MEISYMNSEQKSRYLMKYWTFFLSSVIVYIEMLKKQERIIMIISLLHILLAGIILVLIPVSAGNALVSVLKLKKNIALLYVSGWLLIWAVFQLITVPLVMKKVSFTIAFIVLTILTAIFCVYGICKRNFIHITFSDYKNSEKTVVICMFVLIAALLLVTLMTQHTDADDSRFVVNAVDMLRTDTMYLSNPATGNIQDSFVREVKKDVTAPWAVFIAWCARLTGVHATIMAHTVLPIILLLAAVCVWWMMSEVFFGDHLIYRSLFFDMVLFLSIYGHFSIYTEECFLLTRIWQGKAVIAGVGIPAAYTIGCWIYDEGKYQYYILLFFLNLSMCLMSGMGVIIGTLMMGCMGMVYGISKRNWRVICILWMFCIPNIIYYGLYRFLH